MSHHRLHSIESVLSVRDGLEPSEMGELLESAVKFFLFQRTQIPVPFNSLHASTDNDDDDTSGLEIQDGFELIQDQYDEQDQSDCENPIDRQRRLKQHRLQNLRQRRVSLKMKKTRRLESKIRGVLEEGFQILRKVLQSPSMGKGDAAALVLIFGPSVRVAKEMVIFEIDPNAVKLSSNDTSTSSAYNTSEHNKSQETVAKLDNAIRQFYRSIICTSAFGEFTDKQLRSTYIHMTLMTRNQLSSNILNDHDVRLLEDFCIPENLYSGNADLGNHGRTATSCGRGRNILHVRIRTADTDSSWEVTKTSKISNHSAFNIFSGLSRSYNCYQIPMIFKGVQFHLSNKHKNC